MGNLKKSSHHHYLCSIRVISGEQEYTIYELKTTEKPFTEQDYYREVLEFCDFDEEEINAKLKKLAEGESFEEWPYDDRMYCDPWVQDITKMEEGVLRKYIYCR